MFAVYPIIPTSYGEYPWGSPTGFAPLCPYENRGARRNVPFPLSPPVCQLLIKALMPERPTPGVVPPASPSPDIVFACAHCATSLVVDAAAAGVAVECQHCGQATTVPDTRFDVAAGDAVRISDLQHQLKENESQRTEITGYINQLSIQLHRWQLRLQTLDDRQQKLQAELAAVAGKRW